jgi:hypothetical protein
MIVILEDNKDHSRLLKNALLAEIEGLDPSSIHTIDTVEKAQSFIREREKGAAPPLAILADIALGSYWYNGVNFIQEYYSRMVRETGGGVWTALISIHDITRDFALKDPLPHFTIDKNNKDWPAKCAKSVASLCLPAFPFDDGNDLSPPPELRPPPAARVYLFSCADASRLSAQQAPPDSFRAFSRVKDCYENVATPLLMYRGHYIKTGDVSPKAVRVLLRWRTAALALGDAWARGQRPEETSSTDFSIKHICSWKPASQQGDALLDEEEGFPLRSINNDIGKLRRNPELEALERFLLEKKDRDFLRQYPNVRKVLIPKKQEKKQTATAIKISNRELAATRLPLLKVPGGGAVLNNLLTRLHFVLTDAEVANHLRWKQQWEGYFLSPGA